MFVYILCREEKNYTLRILLGFPVQYNVKDRLLASLFNIKSQSEVAKTKMFAEDCREIDLKCSIFIVGLVK